MNDSVCILLYHRQINTELLLSNISACSLVSQLTPLVQNPLSFFFFYYYKNIVSFLYLYGYDHQVDKRQ